MNSIRALFFPTGVVHPKYIEYVGWSFISNVLVSAESAMSTHSILHAIGTDSETIRTANYIGKDIIGQIGGLAYISKMGKHSDKDPKKFLFYSNILQQFAYASLCFTPILPEYFLPIAGCSNILINISFIGFGAINAKCIQALATNENIGEIYSKISVVNTIGSSIGLLIGLGIITIIPDHTLRLFFIPVLGICRVGAFNRAVKGIF
jgi:hypothetical protein